MFARKCKPFVAAAGGGFPTVRDSETYASGGDTSHSVTLPTHQSGDLLVVFVSGDGNTTVSDAGDDGWSVYTPSTNVTFAVFSKVAASASETLTVGFGASETIAAIGFSIYNFDTDNPIFNASTTGTSTDPAWPTNSPGIGSISCVVFACAAWDNGSTVPSGSVTDFSNSILDIAAPSFTSVTSVWWDEFTGSSFSPSDTLTIDPSEQWATATTVIPGA